MRDSKALVTVPEIGVEALAALPMHHKTKRSEIVQRRLRRPFSVAEVEALVQAVEKLGTGRYSVILIIVRDRLTIPFISCLVIEKKLGGAMSNYVLLMMQSIGLMWI